MSTLLRAMAGACAAAAVGTATAQAPAADLADELRQLKARIQALEAQLAPAAPATPTWGMTPEQVREFNRIAVKTEALEDERETLGLKGLKISGHADPSVVWNQRQNRFGAQFLSRASQQGYTYDNSFFGTVSIDFQKETESGTRWRLTLVPNRGIGSVVDEESPIHEASVSIPLGDLQTRLIAGQIPDWSGYEYLQPTLNKLITHNLLFDFTLPNAYTGAGLDITRGKWIAKAVLGNVNRAMARSDHRAPALAYRVDYARGEFQGFGFAGVHGPAANGSENQRDAQGAVIAQRDSRIDLFEIDAYFIRGDWTLQGQWSLGRQRRAAITPDATGGLRDARWQGVSVLAAYKFTPRAEAIVRLDHLRNRANGGGLLGYASADDVNGIGPAWSRDSTGTWQQADPDRGVNRSALSLGLGFLLNENTTLKAEYRLDHASGAVFADVARGGYRSTNQVVAGSMVVSF